MTDPAPAKHFGTASRVSAAIRARFSLHEDKAGDADIDERLRSGVEMRGTNLWVLMFAIFIASAGLNVNSTAVIIGAMLISPLMGPIMGIGYGAGIYDAALVRISLKNLGIAALLALLVSTAYFAASPLTAVQSELLARTTPTMWDVLIALFGGLAGIVAATRRERSNVIPGVAIATALMPPLCTAGFGLATANWPYFLGAIYLFTINSVFIASSTAIVVRALHLPQKRFVDERAARRMHRLLGTAVVLTVLPSLYLAYQLVQDELFRSRAAQFVHRQLEFDRSHVVTTTIDARTHRIEVTLVGEVVPAATLAEVAARLPADGLGGSDLKIFQTGDQRIDVAALKSTLLSDLYKESQAASERKDKVIAGLRAELGAMSQDHSRFDSVPAELHALFPAIAEVRITQAPVWTVAGGWNPKPAMAVDVRAIRALSRDDRSRIEQWLRTRLAVDAVTLEVTLQAS